MSRDVRKPDICICENKDADQLRSNREADQCLCFRHTDSAIPLLPKSEISSLSPSSVAVQPGLCRTWSETPKTGFLTTRLIYISGYTPGIYAEGYIVFVFPFVRSSVCMFVCSFLRSYFRRICVKVLRQSFTSKFLKWCISQQLLTRKHSYLDHSYLGGLALTL